MKSRFAIRYAGLAIGVASTLLVPKVLFLLLEEDVVTQVLVALGLAAFFAFFDFGASRYFYKELSSAEEGGKTPIAALGFSTITFAVLLAICSSSAIIYIINSDNDLAAQLAIIGAMGAFSVALPWYKNLLDGEAKYIRGELLLFLRRLQPAIFLVCIGFGMGLMSGSLITIIVIAIFTIFLCATGVWKGVHAGAVEYFQFLRKGGPRSDSTLWAFSENLIYNSPIWLAFFYLPVSSQGEFVIIIRIFNFVISIIRAPIEIKFLSRREHARSIYDLRCYTLRMMALSILVMSILGFPLIIITGPVVEYLTNGAIETTTEQALGLYLLVLAATAMHPVGLASTAFSNSFAWASKGSIATAIFLLLLTIGFGAFGRLSATTLILIFASAISLNAAYLVYKLRSFRVR